jgi:hypothetical protein
VAAAQELKERLGEPRRRQARDDIEARLGHPVDQAVRGVLRPVPGFALATLVLVVLVAGVLAPIVAPNGVWFVVLAALGGAAVGIALFVAVPKLTGRQRPVVVAVAGEDLMVYELTAAQRAGNCIVRASRDSIATRTLPAWRRWVDGLRGGMITVDEAPIGVRQRLDLDG